jgi:hypothetical protein
MRESHPHEHDISTTFRSFRAYSVSALPPLAPRSDSLAYPPRLQGHIAIDSAVFPEGTPGFVLDAYARRALWAEGLDYAHGTGTFLSFPSYADRSTSYMCIDK